MRASSTRGPNRFCRLAYRPDGLLRSARAAGRATRTRPMTTSFPSRTRAGRACSRGVRKAQRSRAVRQVSRPREQRSPVVVRANPPRSYQRPAFLSPRGDVHSNTRSRILRREAMNPPKAGAQPVGDQSQQPTHRPRSMALPASESQADLLATSSRTRRKRSGHPPQRQPLGEAMEAGRKPAGSMRPLPRGRKGPGQTSPESTRRGRARLGSPRPGRTSLGSMRPGITRPARKRPGRKRPGQMPPEGTPSGRTQPSTKWALPKRPASNRPRSRSRGSAVVDGPVSPRPVQPVADME
jgi:hypothetical protein